MKTDMKAVLCAVGVLFGSTQLAADEKSTTLVECEKKYKALENKYWAYEQETRASLYDYIEGNMDHERAMQDIGECLELGSIDAIRKCIKPHISLYMM